MMVTAALTFLVHRRILQNPPDHVIGGPKGGSAITPKGLIKFDSLLDPA